MQGIKEALAKIKNGLIDGTLKTQKKDVQCYICMDSGVIFHTKRENGSDYEYTAHCTCPAGNEYQYNGQECSHHKGKYRMQSIDEIMDPEEIAKDNRRKYKGGTK